MGPNADASADSPNDCEEKSIPGLTLVTRMIEFLVSTTTVPTKMGCGVVIGGKVVVVVLTVVVGMVAVVVVGMVAVVVVGGVVIGVVAIIDDGRGVGAGVGVDLGVKTRPVLVVGFGVGVAEAAVVAVGPVRSGILNSLPKYSQVRLPAVRGPRTIAVIVIVPVPAGGGAYTILSDALLSDASTCVIADMGAEQANC